MTLYYGANIILLMNCFLTTSKFHYVNRKVIDVCKTTICPNSLKILGWVWKECTLESAPHKINALITCRQEKTVKQLRSFVLSYLAYPNAYQIFRLFYLFKMR